MNTAIREFSAKVSRYFLDFIETDFKKQQAPRRKIQLRNESGFRTGLPLRKYPTLYSAVWKVLATPASDLAPIRIARGGYKAPISPALQNLIHQHVDAIEAAAFENVCTETLVFAKAKRGKAIENPETYVEDVKLTFVDLVAKHIVAPILAFLDGPFREQSYSAVESVYEVETDLVGGLTAPALEQITAALNTYIVAANLAPTERVLADLFSEEQAKEQIKAFFDDFATADAYQEVRDLISHMRLGGDDLKLYLYVCELRYGHQAFPVFYIPATVTLDDKSGDITIALDPHLYIHKRAIDFIAQELESSAAKLALSPIDNRIIYLPESRAFLDEMERTLTRMSPSFDLSGDFDVRIPRIQTIDSTRLRLSKTAYFAVFDRSDEALLNDYEALLSVVRDDQQGVNELFLDIIRGFLVDEPESARERVADAWDQTTIAERLVAVSPIPLNEEQRRIQYAVNDPKCRFITVQGPPGTGKSHTITAIAFDCILTGKNVLILSDKKEALDVVEDKLKAALATVRQDADFPDPILRLGKASNSYTRLISQASQERIRAHYRAAKTHNGSLAEETESARAEIQGNISRTVDAYSSVDLRELEELHQIEEMIEARAPGLLDALQHTRGAQHLGRLTQALASLGDAAAASKDLSQKFPVGGYTALLDAARAYSVAATLTPLRQHSGALRLFRELETSQQPVLQNFIGEYDDLRLPVIGYLFRARKVRALNQRVGAALPCVSSLDLHKRVDDLRIVHGALLRIGQSLADAAVPDALSGRVYRILATEQGEYEHAKAVRELFEAIEAALQGGEGLRALSVGKEGFPTAAHLITFIANLARYTTLWHKVGLTLASAPSFDYVGAKTHLEQLYTTRMTHEIDRRFIEFVDNNRTTAKTIGGVIKAKQQFPQDAFDGLKQAFPCIIAGIREFAEYVPLREHLFDVVVIDEGSQVSVAQAFPALIRGKKVVVFGDAKQFSNVKAANASTALNNGYITDLEQYFRANLSQAADKLQRLKQFDVKRSVLEFFDLTAGYTDMLRKHFRGYQELISFSSQYFYGGQLQAIKVRGKPIEEVIEFSLAPPAAALERYRNVNTGEAAFIIERLRQMVDSGEGQSVGIITPFKEQQQYLTKLAFADAYGPRFERDLRLKIMTFDTCQGDERDCIIISLVATVKKDALNYIFPVTLEDTEERVEEALKFQRLNVGFSRAREKLHFVISKPIEGFHGAIGRVLQHYKALLDARSMPEERDTDPNSPMEGKVLDWISKTAFYQNNQERLELLAQFPVGDYLRQLDPAYHHPSYRCDFLMRYRGEGKTVQVIIEYDGFQEHFREHSKIHRGNYTAYYRPEDIERQMVLEGYGYKFLRINRFNLGRDPVLMLSERLHALIDAAVSETDVPLVSRIKDSATALANGSEKHCRKCAQVKPIDKFFDMNLANGLGAYGQICLDCKQPAKAAIKLT